MVWVCGEAVDIDYRFHTVRDLKNLVRLSHYGANWGVTVCTIHTAMRRPMNGFVGSQLVQLLPQLAGPDRRPRSRGVQETAGPNPGRA